MSEHVAVAGQMDEAQQIADAVCQPQIMVDGAAASDRAGSVSSRLQSRSSKGAIKDTCTKIEQTRLPGKLDHLKQASNQEASPPTQPITSDVTPSLPPSLRLPSLLRKITLLPRHRSRRVEHVQREIDAPPHIWFMTDTPHFRPITLLSSP